MMALDDMLASDVLTIGMRADEVRRRSHGNVVTYLRVHTVHADEFHAETSFPDAAAEVRLYETPATLDEAVAEIASITARAQGRRVVAYSMADLEERARGGWGTIPGVLERLITAGLSDVAELPIDRLVDLSQSVRALNAAGIHPTRLTVSHPLGDRKVDVLNEVRAWLGQYRSPIRFAPLPRLAPVDKPTTGYEDVRMVALSRLALDDVIEQPTSIEVDWSLYGAKLAQVALTFGADHLDGVSATSDPALGPRRATVEDVERNIRAAGFEPREYRPTA
jgi:aminodeoxyfutalosine synthase